MTPTESLAHLTAAQAAEATAKAIYDASKAATAAATTAAFNVYADDWIARAREALPCPTGAIEEYASQSRTDWRGVRAPGQTMRRVTTLASTTKAGGVRLLKQVQRVEFTGYTTFGSPRQRPMVEAFADPITVKATEETHAGNTYAAASWREKFAKVKS